MIGNMIGFRRRKKQSQKTPDHSSPICCISNKPTIELEGAFISIGIGRFGAASEELARNRPTRT